MKTYELQNDSDSSESLNLGSLIFRVEKYEEKFGNIDVIAFSYCLVPLRASCCIVPSGYFQG